MINSAAVGVDLAKFVFVISKEVLSGHAAHTARRADKKCGAAVGAF